MVAVSTWILLNKRQESLNETLFIRPTTAASAVIDLPTMSSAIIRPPVNSTNIFVLFPRPTFASPPPPPPSPSPSVPAVEPSPQLTFPSRPPSSQPPEPSPQPAPSSSPPPPPPSQQPADPSPSRPPPPVFTENTPTEPPPAPSSDTQLAPRPSPSIEIITIPPTVQIVTTIYQGNVITYTSYLPATTLPPRTVWHTIAATQTAVEGDASSVPSASSTLPTTFLFLFIGVVVLGGILSLVWCFRTIFSINRDRSPADREERRKRRVAKALQDDTSLPKRGILATIKGWLWPSVTNVEFGGGLMGRPSIRKNFRTARSLTRLNGGRGSGSRHGTLQKDERNGSLDASSASSSLRIPMESIQQNQLQRGAGIEEGSPYRHSAMTDNFRGLEMARFDGDPSLQQLLWTNGHVGNVATSPPVAAGHLRTRPSIDTMSTSMVSQSYHVSPTTVTASHGSIVSDASGSGGSSEILGSNSEGQGVWRSNSGSGLASVPEEDDDSSGSGSQAVRAHSGPRLNSRGARPRMDAPGIYTRSCHLPFYTHPGQTQQQPNPSTSGSSILASPAAPGYVWLQSHSSTSTRGNPSRYPDQPLSDTSSSATFDPSMIYDHTAYDIASTSESETGSYASDAYYQQMWANGYTYDPATTWQQNYVQSAYPYYDAAGYPQVVAGVQKGRGRTLAQPWSETTPPGTMGKEGVEGGFLTADVKRMVEEEVEEEVVMRL